MRTESEKVKLALRLSKKKLRKCMYLHFCQLCEQHIKAGQLYYDGGYNNRAHDLCVKAYSNVICKFKDDKCNCLHATGHTPTSGLHNLCYEEGSTCFSKAQDVICVPLTIKTSERTTKCPT